MPFARSSASRSTGVKDDGEIIGVNPDKAEKLKANIITSIKNKDLFMPCPYFTPEIMEVK